MSIKVKVLHYVVYQDEWRFLLAGGTHKGSELPNPAPDWLSGRSWIEILMLASLPKFSQIAKEFSDHIDEYKKIFDSLEPHRYAVFVMGGTFSRTEVFPFCHRFAVLTVKTNVI